MLKMRVLYVMACSCLLIVTSQKPGEYGYDYNDVDEKYEYEGGTGVPEQEEIDNSVDVGRFWHLSDLHLDFYYNFKASSNTQTCPSSSGLPTFSPGPYGDYRCDSPWKLINSSIYAMKEIYPTPDFILWTGDDTLHTNDENRYLSEDLVVETIANITNLLMEVFPNIKIYSALGNHDYHPKNQMPIGNTNFLDSIADLWKPWLRDEEYDTFKSSGYYSGSNDKFTHLKVVSLNTNIWYSSNKAFNETIVEDPGEQFAWLESILDFASQTPDTKVYIIGHIPPGYFELVDYKYWLYPKYNARYIEMVKRYSDVIVGQFFGHHHTDSFRLFSGESGNPVSAMWIAPGVTPWMTNLPGVDNGANNPGIRLFEFDKSTLIPKDYLQYYLNLEKANGDGVSDWKVEYRATDAFDMNDIGVISMGDLYKKLQSADPACSPEKTECRNNALLQKYAFYNSVSYNEAYCDVTCQRYHVCAIKELEASTYLECVKEPERPGGGSANNLKINKSFTVLSVMSVLKLLYL